MTIVDESALLTADLNSDTPVETNISTPERTTTKEDTTKITNHQTITITKDNNTKYLKNDSAQTTFLKLSRPNTITDDIRETNVNHNTQITTKDTLLQRKTQTTKCFPTPIFVPTEDTTNFTLTNTQISRSNITNITQTTTRHKCIKTNKRNRRLKGSSKNKKRKERQKYIETKKLLSNNIVVNLSKYTLKNSELSVLNKGLGFSLSHIKPKFNCIDNDVRRFERTLQLHFHFTTKEEQSANNYQRKILENNKDWWPPKLNTNITEFCDQIKLELIQSYSHKRCTNLKKEEITALRSLKINKDIIVIRADKGGAICVLDKEEYMNKIFQMLNDEQVYTLAQFDDTIKIKNECDSLINELYNTGFLTYKQRKYLTNFTPKCPRFYGLPKIHKEGCPLRPIVSQIDGPTKGLNLLLDTYLTVAEKNIPYILRDTTAYLNILKDVNLTENSNLFTMDVVSLYTNIPHEEGARWVSDFYEETLHLWDSQAPDIKPVDKNTIYKMIITILENTTFTFDNKYYTQNYGTTMGAIFSVKFANIYMHKWLNNFTPKYTGIKPPFLARLVDDCFGIYNSTREDFSKFLNYLNNCHSTIKFEYSFSNKEVCFLDTITYVSNNKIETKIYIKPTDRKQYLHFDSDHPFHTKNSIPYSQAIRYKRIISEEKEFDAQLHCLKNYFYNRKYPRNLVEIQSLKASNLRREELLQCKHKANTFTDNDSAFLPLIIPHNRSLVDACFRSKLQNMWSIFINSEPNIKRVFENEKPNIIFKRGTTIQQYLNCKQNMTTVTDLDKELTNTLVALFSENYNAPYSGPCGSTRCLCCIHMIKTHTYNNSNNSKVFTIPENFNCSSSEVIYQIKCNLCHKLYVGHTKRTVRDRLNNHISDIKLNKKTTISIHFNQPYHSYNNLQIIAIKSTKDLDINDTVKLEYDFMKNLNTIYPWGLNYYPINKP